MANNLSTVVQNIKHNNKVGSNDKPPMLLNELPYPEWKGHFERYIKAKDLKMWFCMTSGHGERPVRMLTIATYMALTDEQKKYYECEERAMSLITMSLPQSIRHTFSNKNSSKEMWDSLSERCEGNDLFKKRRRDRMKTQFVVFKAMKNESLDDLVNRFYHLLSELDRSQPGLYTEFEKVEKFLNCLPKRWNMFTALIKESPQYDELNLEQAIQKMKGYGWTLEDQDYDFEKLQDPTLYRAKQVENGSSAGVALLSEDTSQGKFLNQSAFVCNNSGNVASGTHTSHGMSSSNANARPCVQSLNVPKLDSHCLKLVEENTGLLASFLMTFENFALRKLVEPLSLDEDLDQIDQDEMEELYLQLNMALLVRRAKKYLQRTGKSFIGGNTKTRMGIVMCEKCVIFLGMYFKPFLHFLAKF
ncbi:hypothetical protein HanIR_Chr16g0817871 [Helianthus annuus]|nr:hypothetical protein HanIR_Chr16g0817871 [Helianthus annuus]